jgi:hypothetical protein
LSYVPDGTPLTETFAATGGQGLRLAQEVDPTGALTGRVWQMNDPVDSGQLVDVPSEDVTENVHGQWVDQTMLPGGHRTYSYDGVGRLTATSELQSGTCTNRGYAFDQNGNRTGENTSSAAATADGNGNLGGRTSGSRSRVANACPSWPLVGAVPMVAARRKGRMTGPGWPGRCQPRACRGSQVGGVSLPARSRTGTANDRAEGGSPSESCSITS